VRALLHYDARHAHLTAGRGSSLEFSQVSCVGLPLCLGLSTELFLQLVRLVRGFVGFASLLLQLLSLFPLLGADLCQPSFFFPVCGATRSCFGSFLLLFRFKRGP
jgi:hypothetical protein